MIEMYFNEKIWNDIKYLGFRGVIPDKVAEAIREAAAPKVKEEADTKERTL
jgi:hypothetical protein